MPEPVISSLEECLAHHGDFEPETDGLYCNATYDTFLCWAPTLAGTYASQNCPPARLSDTSKLVTKRCSIYGFWEGKEPNQTNNNMGWTNYTVCYPLEVQEILVKLNAGNSYKMKLDIAHRTRQLEIFGFSISLIALLISLVIFCYYRNLRNNRTRIHKNLFMAMIMQVLIRLTLYIDQALLRSQDSVTHNAATKGIDNTPYLCEASYVLLEYARTSMFLWMFIEGMYLHNMITVTVFQERQCHGLYHVMGWGFPVLLTSAWAVTTALYFNGQTACWWGYNFVGYYWILEGPRLGVILLNFVFLLNIIRVLVMKLRQSHTSEIEQVRKAVRAAVVLLPLLGITNLLNMTQAPLERAPWEFALWSYTTHFLTSFQGFFVALIYCFLNGEVRTAIAKHISLLMDLREQRTQFRRSSGFHYASSDGNRRDEVNTSDETKHWWNCFTESCKKKPIEIPVCEASAPETVL